MDRGDLRSNPGRLKDIDSWSENKSLCLSDQRRGNAPFQKFGLLFPCHDGSSFDTDPLDQKKKVSSPCATCGYQLIFFDLSNHMTGKNHFFNPGRDLCMSANKRDSKSVTGV